MVVDHEGIRDEVKELGRGNVDTAQLGVHKSFFLGISIQQKSIPGHHAQNHTQKEEKGQTEA